MGRAKRGKPSDKAKRAPAKVSRSIENPAVPLSSIVDDDAMFDALTGGEHSNAGVKVTARKALGLSAVWRGVNLIAGDVGRHIFTVYRYFPGTDLAKQPDTLHPSARVMRKPNDYMTAFTFRQVVQSHALVYGNGYAYIVRSEFDAAPLELLPLDPARTWPVRVNGELWYLSQTESPLPGRRRKSNSYVKIRAADMIHIKGLGFDGLTGYPVLKILRETIGGAVAARDYGSRYFKNDASPGVVIQVPAGMPDKAIANLRSTWENLHVGFRNAHKIAILRDGVTLANYSKATARDAQLLESREFDAREVANVLGIPPHKVGDPSRTAYNSLESENQAYQEDTLDRWFIAWEQECDSKLLTEEQKASETHAHKFDPRPISSVPLAQRGAYYSQAISGGWLCPDEARSYENLNPMPRGAGKIYVRPLNTAPVAPTTTQPAPQPDNGQTDPDSLLEPSRALDTDAIASAVLNIMRDMLRGDKFEESKHPRAPDGKFGSGSGSGGSSDDKGKGGDKGSKKKDDKEKDDKGKDSDKDKGDKGKGGGLTGKDADALKSDLDKHVGDAVKGAPGLISRIKIGALKAADVALSHVDSWASATHTLAKGLYALADNALDTAADVTKKLGYNPDGHAGTSDSFKTGFHSLTGLDSPISGHIAAKVAAVVLSHVFTAIKKRVTGRSEDTEAMSELSVTIASVFAAINHEFNLTGAPSASQVAAVLTPMLKGGDE